MSSVAYASPVNVGATVTGHGEPSAGAMSRSGPSRADAEFGAYRDAVRSFVAREVLPGQAQWQSDRHAGRAVWRKAGALGMLLPDVPQEYGGGGGTAAHAAVLPEELALAGDACLGGILVQGAVAQYLLHHGTPSQKERYLPRLASGEWIAAIAITEPGAGSDIRGMATAATSHPDGYLLTGTKRYVSNGHLADLILVAARNVAVGESARSGPITLLLVERYNVAGVQAGPIPDMIGKRGHDVCDLFLDDVVVPGDAVLGGVCGRGFGQLMGELPYERTLIGVTAVATMERAVAQAAKHARTRKLFGKTLFDLQHARFRLAEARTHAVVARAFIDQCVARLSDGELSAEMAAMAKWFLTDLECKVVDECLQLFGGDGYMAEHPMARMYVDARVQRIYGGANEVMLEVIAEAM
jgi:acyl-CoA dehydrogenase